MRSATNQSDTVRSIRGVSIFERRIGSGPPVVVLHGGPGAHHDYLRPGFDGLAVGRELVFYDQRGGGKSAVPSNVAVGWREQVADLEALREVWGIERLTIAGYSWGGLLAMLYATEYPARVARLALISAAPAWRAARIDFERRFSERSMTPALQAARRALRESGLRESDPTLYQRRIFDLAVAGYFHNPAEAEGLTPFRVTERTRREVWESLGDYDVRPVLGRLEVPAILVHGDEDPIPHEAARIAAECMHAEWHLLRDCGHVPYIEAYDEFVRLIDSFLR